jgi:hypothetical protein
MAMLFEAVPLRVRKPISSDFTLLKQSTHCVSKINS